MKLLLVVAAALLDGEGRVLVTQRPAGKSLAGCWEFPGGKIEPGETPEEALTRELQEELGIDVLAEDLEPMTFASHTYPEMHLLMPLYIVRRWAGQIRSNEGQAWQWVKPDELADLAMPAADYPLAERLCHGLATPPHA